MLYANEGNDYALLNENAVVEVNIGGRHVKSPRRILNARADCHIRQLNDEIPDERMSAQIDLIERLTTQIFDCVKEHPEKLKQIRQFLNYYLPTTIKLMEQYVKLQNQSVKTENITEGMQKIEDLLDKVIVAFQRQLDALFESDVVDITADIRVMEQMMASEGLTEKKDFA